MCIRGLAQCILRRIYRFGENIHLDHVHIYILAEIGTIRVTLCTQFILNQMQVYTAVATFGVRMQINPVFALCRRVYLVCDFM